MIVLITISIICFICDPIVQAFLIEKKGIWINHIISAAVAIAYCFPVAYYFNTGYKLYLAWLALLLARWIYFSPALAVFRNRYRPEGYKLPLTYISDKKKKNSVLDKLLLLLPNPQYSQFIVKFLLLFIAIFIHIIL